MEKKNTIIVLLVLVLLALVAWYVIPKIQNRFSKKSNQPTIADQAKGNSAIKNFSLSGVVTQTGVNSLLFYTGVVRNTDTGSRPVFETKTVIVSDKTAIEKQGTTGTLKLEDIVNGAKITVFASTNPFDLKEFTADKIQIEN